MRLEAELRASRPSIKHQLLVARYHGRASSPQPPVPSGYATCYGTDAGIVEIRLEIRLYSYSYSNFRSYEIRAFHFKVKYIGFARIFVHARFPTLN